MTRIVLAQIEPALGDLRRNLALHEAEVGAARAAGANMVVFPELSLTGYFLKDLVAEVALAPGEGPLARLAELSKDITIAAGFAERGRDGRIYNTLGLFEDGRMVGAHRKVHLVTYGMFDEARDFAPGERFRAIDSKLGRFGVLVCEDMWHLDGMWLHFLAGVDAILACSASPARGAPAGEAQPRSQRTWTTIQDAAAVLTQSHVLYCNRVGCEDGIVFGGGSRVVGPDGVEVARLEGLEPGQLSCALDASLVRRVRTITPLRRDEKPQLVLRDLLALEDAEEA
jgi:predicted amidohydrolase